MKPRLPSLAIQTLVVVYTFAGVYIGCSKSASSKKGLVIPAASSPKPKKTETTGLRDRETSDDDSEVTKEKNRKKSTDDDDRGDDPENDEEESDDSDEDQSSKGKGSKSESSAKEGTNRKPSFCDKKFADLSSKDQAMIRKYANHRLDKDDLENMRITNCKLDKNGDVTFDIDFGRRNRDN